MKDKKGNKVSVKEFFKRWEEGIQGITPLQKVKSQLSGTKITLFGLGCGLAISLYSYKTLWWVAFILTGAFIVTYMQFVGFKQQKKMLEDLEKNAIDINKIMKGGKKC